MEDVRLFIGNDGCEFRPADVNAYNVFCHESPDSGPSPVGRGPVPRLFIGDAGHCGGQAVYN